MQFVPGSFLRHPCKEPGNEARGCCIQWVVMLQYEENIVINAAKPIFTIMDALIVPPNVALSPGSDFII